ncbi:hypothetical protein JG687_00011410 [Phytophthora cactorum]|uniref:Uncharacterized protein n=1 Tax=Phytophthora cactorum TaxID=29920 RepID=A0A8T1U4P5_9STRA|nr:hypothetical protein JG687_00011410 [Phytophthora cactorum]
MPLRFTLTCMQSTLLWDVRMRFCFSLVHTQNTSISGHITAVHWTNASITGLQLGIEIIVDFVACALEIRRGIDFEQLNQDDSFLAVFVIAVSLVNVHISSGMYLSS